MVSGPSVVWSALSSRFMNACPDVSTFTTPFNPPITSLLVIPTPEMTYSKFVPGATLEVLTNTRASSPSLTEVEPDKSVYVGKVPLLDVSLMTIDADTSWTLMVRVS